jgi:hypothetical protein
MYSWVNTLLEEAALSRKKQKNNLTQVVYVHNFILLILSIKKKGCYCQRQNPLFRKRAFDVRYLLLFFPNSFKMRQTLIVFNQFTECGGGVKINM